jgi:hypothetical protein
MNEGMVTVGCIMAEVFALDSGEITSASEGDVKLTFYPTSESETSKLIVTPQMRQLGDAGYSPIAIARIHLDDPSKFYLLAVNGLSASLRSALEHQGCDLVRNALSGLTDEPDEPATSN